MLPNPLCKLAIVAWCWWAQLAACGWLLLDAMDRLLSLLVCPLGSMKVSMVVLAALAVCCDPSGGNFAIRCRCSTVCLRFLGANYRWMIRRAGRCHGCWVPGSSRCGLLAVVSLVFRGRPMVAYVLCVAAVDSMCPCCLSTVPRRVRLGLVWLGLVALCFVPPIATSCPNLPCSTVGRASSSSLSNPLPYSRYVCQSARCRVSPNTRKDDF